ncbi:hypothetical protein A1O1_01957 [Capronia coronata CBS 617.96]|uniref:FAD-binding domain-containing protein n=1 Tax=Capronia coronata CBS 617.96 TaxID=1182541 RepID=W9YV53_9EURO|nr:uncharacterized protein A1O1_01957 [Capronia coronata CBS 617.96]EXJ93565.1 hypothetical protein A1O1_01957 [Capronia coronata CBS 617.96]
MPHGCRYETPPTAIKLLLGFWATSDEYLINGFSAALRVSGPTMRGDSSRIKSSTARIKATEESPKSTSQTIFERDASPNARFFQGGTLDLHPESGLAALKKAGLYDAAHEHLRYDGEEMFITDKNNTVLTHMQDLDKTSGDSEYARPEIDREDLKGLLLKSINPESIHWGKTLQSVGPSAGILTFRDGPTAGPFDLVVGADGAWSKVRDVLTDVRPCYSGICGFESTIPTSHEQYPKISKIVGRGSYLVSSDHVNLTVQRMANESLKVGIWIAGNETYPADLMAAYGSDEAKLKDKVIENYIGWASDILRCIRASTNFRPWPLYELPVGNTWDHRNGFTLIGDAASLMTPFAGEGVNKAMADSLELAEALEQASHSGQDMDEGVRQYETNMFPRAKRYQTLTQRNKVAMFSENGAVNLMVGMVDLIAEELGFNIDKGCLAWIPVRSVMFCWLSFWQKLGIWRRKARELFSSQS